MRTISMPNCESLVADWLQVAELDLRTRTLTSSENVTVRSDIVTIATSTADSAHASHMQIG